MKEPWQPVQGESARSYAAFITYRDMGPGRNFEDLRQKFDQQFNCVSNVAGLRRWARKFCWDDRCMGWEARLNEKKASAELKVQERSVLRLAEEKTRRIAENLQVASLLRGKVLELLSHPVTRVVEDSRSTNEDGTVTYHQTVIEPSKWALRDIAIFAKTACEIEQVDLLNENKQGQFDTSEETMEAAQQALGRFRLEQAKKLEEIDVNPPGTAINPIEVQARQEPS